MGKLMPAFFIINTTENGVYSGINFTNDDFDGEIIGIKRINGDIPGMETTFEEAKELAEDTLKRLGTVENVELVYTELGVYRAVPDEDWISTRLYSKKIYFLFCQ